VRQAYELAAERYGPAAMSPVVVLLPPGHQGEVTKTVRVIAADRQVAAVTPHVLPDGSEALLVTAKADPYSPAVRALVLRLRTGSLHTALGGVPYWVGGETADSIDATQAMFNGLPEVGLALLVILALLLLFALRSVFLPIKAVVLVILSLGASLGSLLLLVTTRLGATLIGASGPEDIHPIVPITIVAITVALSTDYEVILISRIAEHYRRTGDNRAAVVHGIEHTGSVITSAAAIMVAVFAGFALADLLPVKQLGVGLGLAVFLDATVVRGVLVPAAMAVMGRGNWWWPRVELRRHRSAVPAELPQEIATTAVPAELPQEIATRAVPLSRAAFALEIAALVDEGSVREKTQAAGAFGDYADAARRADAGAARTPAGSRQRDEFAVGRIHLAADVKQTVVLSQIRQELAG
jgi:uncharacterized membrane protein YdfJ with MMPL/SSD domain